MGHGEALKGPRHPQVCCSGLHACVGVCRRVHGRAMCVRAYVYVLGGRVVGARVMCSGVMPCIPLVQMELQAADESSKVDPLRLLRLANMCARVGDSLDGPAIAPSVPHCNWNARDLNVHGHVRNRG